MSKFFTLASSSSGNSSFIFSNNCGILIDCGISARACKNALIANNHSLDDIKAIFITHEHIDHIKGLKVLLKYNNIPLYSSEKILSHLCKNDLIPSNANINIFNDKQMVCDEMEVSPFQTNHDSVESYGFLININNEKKACVLTDNGHMNEQLEEKISGVDLLMIESNYDKAMLLTGEYPYYLKRRIQSDIGHMSNEQCAAAVKNAVLNFSKNIVLSHLSKENNYPVLARQETLQTLHSQGLQENIDFTLSVAPANNPSETILF
ncbi:MAG: MBL fold metallo-hydrolase [Oscillospiraceae bacterium]